MHGRILNIFHTLIFLHETIIILPYSNSIYMDFICICIVSIERGSRFIQSLERKCDMLIYVPWCLIYLYFMTVKWAVLQLRLCEKKLFMNNLFFQLKNDYFDEFFYVKIYKKKKKSAILCTILYCKKNVNY